MRRFSLGILVDHMYMLAVLLDLPLPNFFCYPAFHSLSQFPSFSLISSPIDKYIVDLRIIIP